jgi:hypothetical protein
MSLYQSRSQTEFQHFIFENNRPAHKKMDCRLQQPIAKRKKKLVPDHNLPGGQQFISDHHQMIYP